MIRDEMTLRVTPGRVLTLAISALVPLAGCVVQPPMHGMISRQEQTAFRDAALGCLQDAACSDQPSLRMNALEALAEVAPVEGLPYIAMNIENEYAGASFAALMALGSMRSAELIERIRTRAEHPDPNVRIAALYALHQLGNRGRSGELSEYLLHHRDARVRANAALAIGRLAEPSSINLLRRALEREEKDLPKLQILEALAILGDKHATERLILIGHSSYPDQATLGLMFLANARSDAPKAESLYAFRLHSVEYPEARLQAARALGQLGGQEGLEIAIAHLWFKSPKKGRPNDPPEQQIARIRGLAALALKAIGSPRALFPLKAAFELEGQPAYVRVAIARAAIRIIDKNRRPPARREDSGGWITQRPSD